MPVRKLREFLNDHGVKYVTISHSPAFTAQEIAASAHVPGKELAKTVMVKIDGNMALTVLPASYRVDLRMLKSVAGAADVTLATEAEFKHRFPDCELGAMPPFGNLWHVPVYVAEALAEDEQIAFNAGTHTELVQMRFEDYKRVAEPTIVPLGHAVA